jgi:hypothetical protein
MKGLVVVIAALITACGSSSTGGISHASSAVTPSPSAVARTHSIQIVKVGFGSDEFSTMAVAVLQNTSATDAAELVQVQMAAYDANNTVVGSSNDIVFFMRANSKAAAAAPIQVTQGAKVTQVKVEASATRWDKDPHPEATIDSDQVKFDSGQFGMSQVTGLVVSRYVSDLKDLTTTAVCYDGSGTIIGGGIGIVQLLPGGSKVGTSVQVTVSGSPANCELYASVNAGSAPQT